MLESRGVSPGDQAVDEDESCQCRTSRIQCNHIAHAMLVWSRLKQLAYQDGQSIYQTKRGLLHDYLVQQLKDPSFEMVLA